MNADYEFLKFIYLGQLKRVYLLLPIKFWIQFSENSFLLIPENYFLLFPENSSDLGGDAPSPGYDDSGRVPRVGPVDAAGQPERDRPDVGPRRKQTFVRLSGFSFGLNFLVRQCNV